jgi:hypothetical protein
MDIMRTGEYPEILSIDRCSALQQGPGKWNDFSGMDALGDDARRRHIHPWLSRKSGDGPMIY